MAGAWWVLRLGLGDVSHIWQTIQWALPLLKVGITTQTPCLFNNVQQQGSLATNTTASSYAADSDHRWHLLPVGWWCQHLQRGSVICTC